MSEQTKDDYLAAAVRVADAQDGPPSVMADLGVLLARELGPVRLNELLDEAYRRAEENPHSAAMNEAVARGELWPPQEGL